MEIKSKSQFKRVNEVDPAVTAEEFMLLREAVDKLIEDRDYFSDKLDEAEKETMKYKQLWEEARMLLSQTKKAFSPAVNFADIPDLTEAIKNFLEETK